MDSQSLLELLYAFLDFHPARIKTFAVIKTKTVFIKENEIKPIVVRNHGRKLFSLFTYGLDWLKDCFCSIANDQLKILSIALKKRFSMACQ